MRVWNEMPEEVVEGGTMTTFKRHLDRYMDGKGLEGYGPNAGKWDEFNLGNLVGMDKLGRRACFRAVCLYGSIAGYECWWRLLLIPNCLREDGSELSS